MLIAYCIHYLDRHGHRARLHSLQAAPTVEPDRVADDRLRWGGGPKILSLEMYSTPLRENFLKSCKSYFLILASERRLQDSARLLLIGLR